MTVRQPAADDFEAIRARLAEIKLEAQQPQPEESWPVDPCGPCHLCRENRAPCNGTCYFD